MRDSHDNVTAKSHTVKSWSMSTPSELFCMKWKKSADVLVEPVPSRIPALTL